MGTLIRLAEPRDGPALADIYRPAVTDSSISFELVPPDGEEMTKRAARVSERTPWLVWEKDGQVHGYAYAASVRDRAAYQWSVEVSAYVHADSRRMGVARMLYTSLFAALVVQGFRNAYAGITLPNPASVGFHTAMRFTSIGIYRGIGYKHGAWHDVVWLERPLAPRDIDPPEPLPLPVCRDQPAFRRALETGMREAAGSISV